ncbi:MAG TPA: MFS transporter [Dongiaceae bacterium]
MKSSYFRFLAKHWDGLLFGALLMLLSSFGQTFYVSLFGVDFRAAFGLSDGGLGTAYAVGTFGSAMTLPWVGRLIDITTVRRYTCCVAALLAAACLLTAAAPSVVVLAIAFYFLRLGGQGLMVHTGLTATARAFPADSGKALGVVALGFSVAQAVLPLAAVAAMGAIGWRLSWVAGAAIVVAGTALALAFLPHQPDEHADIRNRRKLLAATARQPLWRDPRLLFTLPAILASPFISTGFFFHQARLAQEKGWTLGWVAGWFVAYAICQAFAVLAIGPLIDRMGPRRLMPLFLAPLGLGMLALAVSDSIWVAPIYLILIGLTSAVASTLATALWVELYGPSMLARVRSLVEAALVVASGASPVIMGLLIDRGVPLRAQAAACLVYTLVASGLATRIPGRPPGPVDNAGQ